jgi:cobalt-zinc-cadmium efflux system membrane fusion protein
MHFPNRKTLAAALVAAGLANVACTKRAPAVESSPAESKDKTNPMEVEAQGKLVQQLKVGEAVWSEVSASQTVAARVEVDRRGTTRVGSPMMGRITSLFVQEGEHVKRGEVMALLNSPGLSDSQLVFLKALSERQLAQKAVDRAQLLLKAGIIGSAELQRREAELTQTVLDVEAAKDHLGILGMASDAIAELEKSRAISSTSRILATSDGIVLSHNIRPGQVIEPADTVFEIADLSNVWLVADVPEQSGGNLRTGEEVNAEIAAFPGQQIHGSLSFVSATVDPDTRTIRVRMNLPNPSRRYKPAMLATMTLRDAPQRHQLIPASAVVRNDNQPCVFIQTGDDRFVLRPVTLGEEYAGERIVQDGIARGEKIVLDGAFHLNNERMRRLLRGREGS